MYYAQMLFLAMSRYLLMKAAAAAECEPDEIQQKGAVLSVAAYVTRLLLEKDPDVILDSLQAMLRRIGRRHYRKRDGRSFPQTFLQTELEMGLSGTQGRLMELGGGTPRVSLSETGIGIRVIRTPRAS